MGGAAAEQHRAEGLEAVCEGAWLGSCTAQPLPEGKGAFSERPVGNLVKGREPPQSAAHWTPQDANSAHVMDTGPGFFSNSLHTKAPTCVLCVCCVCVQFYVQ